MNQINNVTNPMASPYETYKPIVTAGVPKMKTPGGRGGKRTGKSAASIRVNKSAGERGVSANR